MAMDENLTWNPTWQKMDNNDGQNFQAHQNMLNIDILLNFFF
jgi:hypothetical protein